MTLLREPKESTYAALLRVVVHFIVRHKKWWLDLFIPDIQVTWKRSLSVLSWSWQVNWMTYGSNNLVISSHGDEILICTATIAAICPSLCTDRIHLKISRFWRKKDWESIFLQTKPATTLTSSSFRSFPSPSALLHLDWAWPLILMFHHNLTFLLVKTNIQSSYFSFPSLMVLATEWCKRKYLLHVAVTGGTLTLPDATY